jgi:hypothetical protein
MFWFVLCFFSAWIISAQMPYSDHPHCHVFGTVQRTKNALSHTGLIILAGSQVMLMEAPLYVVMCICSTNLARCRFIDDLGSWLALV